MQINPQVPWTVGRARIGSINNNIKVVQMRHSKKFQCKECSRTFVHLEKAEKHVETEHLDDSSGAAPTWAALTDDKSTKRNTLKDKAISGKKGSNFENDNRKRVKTKLETNVEARKNSPEKTMRLVTETPSRRKPTHDQTNRTAGKRHVFV